VTDETPPTGLSIPEREDRRRELALQILVAATVNQIPALDMMQRFRQACVGPVPPPTDAEASPYFRIVRFEDYLPDDAEWASHADAVARRLEAVDAHASALDAIIVAASPRWRIDRMPVIDRSLLRLGVVEMKFLPEPRARATINGMIELAKRYGETTTPRFVNGILDQIRRDLGVPFQ
jgi:transcription antitermination factor NusB